MNLGCCGSLKTLLVLLLFYIVSIQAWNSQNQALMLWKLPQSLKLRPPPRTSLLTLSMSPEAPLRNAQSLSTTSESPTDYSLESLQGRVKVFVEKYGNSCRLALAVAGGGSNFLSTLASTPGASQVLLEGVVTYDRESYRQYVKLDMDTESFRYCSSQSAALASQAALHRALQISAAADPQYGHFPLYQMTHAMGVACASALRSSNTSNSRAFITTTLSDSRQVQMQVQLTDSDQRSRFDEDVFVSHCILTCVEYALQTNSLKSTVKQETPQGDEWKIELPPPATTDPDQVIRQAVDRILSGNDESVCLLPCDNGFQALSHTYLPPQSLIIPGSFNPPHVGHVQLAQSGLDTTNCPVAYFELSLTNADKPSLQPDDVIHRIQQFLKLQGMPRRWGILLTDAPLFQQKVNLLQPRQVSTDPLHFVIGTDTLVRLLDPKYYDHSKEKMLEILRAMPCQFVVGGRMEQKTEHPSFVSGQDDVSNLPSDLQAKFTILKDFRVDISSTELRRQQTQE